MKCFFWEYTKGNKTTTHISTIPTGNETGFVFDGFVCGRPPWSFLVQFPGGVVHFSSHLRSQITKNDTWKQPVDIDLHLCILTTSIISTSYVPYGFFTRVRSDSRPVVRIEVHRLNDVLPVLVELQCSKSYKTGSGVNKLLTYQGEPFRDIPLTGWMRHSLLPPSHSLHITGMFLSVWINSNPETSPL